MTHVADVSAVGVECSCGWAFLVGPHSNIFAAQAAWNVHRDRAANDR